MSCSHHSGVLIHAAASGVGQAAARMAEHYGATVIATASAGEHAAVRALGADHVIDYRTEDVTARVMELTCGRDVDLVLESVGDTFAASLAAAKRVTGRVVVYGVAAGPATVSKHWPGWNHGLR